MAKVYVIGAMKGGTAKTVTTYNLAYSLAEQEKRVLAIDFDAQGNLTTCFGVEDPAAVRVTIGDLMLKVLEEEVLPAKSEYIRQREGVDFIPASMLLSAVDAKLRLEMGTEKILSRIIDAVKGDYDYVLIDTCPSLGALTINALSAADEVIVTVNPQLLAMMGLQDFLRTVTKIRNRINGTLRHDEIVRELEVLTGKKDTHSGGQNGHRRKSRDIIAAEYGFSSRSAARLLRLNKLIPEFKRLVDDGNLALLAAVDLSFLTEEEQKLVWDIISRQNLKVKPKMAAELRNHSGDLTVESIAEIIDAVTVRQHSVNAGVSLRLPNTICEKYFTGMNTEQMAAVVEQALAAWYEEKAAC